MATTPTDISAADAPRPLSELSRRALAFYRENLQISLEPEQEGKGIAIHPDTSDYVVAETPTHASRAMRLRHPAGSFVSMRIGPSPDYALISRMGFAKGAKMQIQTENLADVSMGYHIDETAYF